MVTVRMVLMDLETLELFLVYTCLLLLLFFIASARPYKKTTINVVVSFMFGLTAFYLTVISHTFAEHKHIKVLIFILLICILVPHLVLISYISYKLLSRSNNCVCHIFQTIHSKPLSRFFNDKSSEHNHYDSEHEDSSLLDNV